MKIFTLGPEGVRYVRSRLEAGGTLAHKLTTLRLESGSITAKLPGTSTPDQRLHFEAGGIVRDDPGTAREGLTTLITDYLERDPSHWCVIEERLFTVKESSLPSWGDYLTYGSEVYWYFGRETADREVVRHGVIGPSGGYLLIGVLSKMGPAFKPAKGQAIAQETIEAFAAGADHIIVSAYDEEAYLIWHRP